MSDPMTNTEVEDVLASIRRLVSDDKRPETAAEPTPAQDRLVLTPSLRVMEDADVAEDVAESDTHAKAGEDQPSDDVLHMSIHEAFAEDDTPDAVEDLDAPGQGAETAEAALAEDVAEDATDVSADDHDERQSDAVEDVQDSVAEDDADTLSDIIAEAAVEDVAAEDAAVEDEAIEDDEAEEMQAEVIPPEAEAAPREAEKGAAEQRTLSEKIAALETLLGTQGKEFEPDAGEEDTPFVEAEAPTMTWEDAEPEPAFTPTAAPEPAAPDEDDEATAAQIFSSDEDVLDEEALRELVSDIVREELQGALGERITRNVRKLVRREIHRALAAQELE
ncbi:MAG: hypothetical protein AAFQ19_12780 [Pseudomonadota bacterium]